MTYAPSQIQALIDEIDGVLSKASPRVPWVMSGDIDRQRRVLQQTRECLVSLQQQMDAAPGNRLLAINGALPLEQLPTLPNGMPPTAEAAQQVLQAVLQEMGYLRTNLMQPLRYELDMLRQQRDSLMQEIRSLEAQKQQAVLPAASIDAQQIGEMMQSMMAQMQQNLTAQVAQLLTHASSPQLQEGVALGALPAGVDGSPALTPAQRLELLQRLQSQSDQMLLKLDSSTRIMYESLLSNVQTYQDSLEQGLGKLHNLGQQGEAVFSALISRLAQQLGRETSNYLQSSEVNPSLPQTPPAPPLAASHDHTNDHTDDEISQLLEQLGGQATVMQPSEREPGEPSSGMRLVTGDVIGLNDLHQELDDLSLEVPGSNPFAGSFDEELTFLQTDQPVTRFGATDDEDITLLQIDALHELEANPVSEDDELWQVDDLESAIDLLNEVSPVTVDDEPTLIQPPHSPDAATDDELDELYASLFGEDAIANLDPDAEPPVDRFVAQARPVESPVQASDPQPTTVDMIVERQIPGVAPGANPAPPFAETSFTLEEDLFGGLDDPAQEWSPLTLETAASSAEPPLGLVATPEATPEITLEALLFEPPPQPSAPPEPQLPALSSEAELPSLEDFAHWQSVDEAVAHLTLPETADDRDIISSLSDLVLPLEEKPSAVTGAAPVPIVLPVEEDSFEPASPDEDLLAVEERLPVVPMQLEVANDTLQRLSDDLSNFEQFGDALSEPEAPPPPLAPVPASAGPAAPPLHPPLLTLANGTPPAEPPAKKVQWEDLFAQAEAAVLPEPSPAPMDAIAEDLFADFPAEPTATPVDPPGNPAIRAALADLFGDAPAPQVSAEGLRVAREAPPAIAPPPPAETAVVRELPAEPPPLAPIPTDENLDDFFADFSEDIPGDMTPDLSLEDFQAEMQAPANEAIDRVTADMLMELLKDDLPIASDSAIDSSLPIAPVPVENAISESNPPMPQAEAAGVVEQPDQADFAAAPASLEEWGDLFSSSSLADLGDAVPLPPASEPELTPDNLFSGDPPAPTANPAPADPQAPPLEESANAFTLEGLDSLFEDLPPISAFQDADGQAKDANDCFQALRPRSTDRPFGVDFGSQASLDLYADDPGTEEAQKKRS